MKFAIIDVNNLVHRAKHVIQNYDTFDECVGLVLTIVFNSLKKSYDRFGAEHCVACFDSYSWRKDIYKIYKANRGRDFDDLSPQKIEEHEIIKAVLNDLRQFLKDFTNVTVLDAPSIEADDFVARWVQLHDDGVFSHVIISGDGDFKQLVRKNVELFNPLSPHTLYTIDGVFIYDGKKRGKKLTVQKHGQTWKVKINNKTGQPEIFDPEWELFKKCIRGDSSDNIKSAFPKVRETRMRKAWEDKGGLEWNNFINETWGPEDDRQSVRERYELNRQLVDLSRQPEHIILVIDKAMDEALKKERKQMVGTYFAKFCSVYQLNNLMNQADPIVRILSSSYDV